MKKLIGALLTLAAASALAQAPFTIVRPAEGQTVRETIAIVMPKNSIPAGAFIGVTVDGKFLEATVPVPNAAKTHLVYWLDTKTRGISDGMHTIGITLYMSRGAKPEIADKSEVKVKVSNHGGISVPANGLLINYKFWAGKQNRYTINVGQELSTMTEAQNKRGGRAAQLPMGSESLRMLFSVDDVKANGVGLVRSQLLPYKGKDYLAITTSLDDKLTIHKANEFAAVYRLLRPNGQEAYGDIPVWWGFDGSSSRDSDTDLVAFIPLPILPTARLQIGDSWQASIAMAEGTIAGVRETGKSIEKIPARGTFEAVEWEQGKACARLKYELEIARKAAKDTKSLQLAGREFKDNDKLRFSQMAWVSISDGTLVRSDMIIEADTKVAVGDSGSGGGGNSGGGTVRPGGGKLAGGGSGSGGRGIDVTNQGPGSAGFGEGPGGAGRPAGGGGQGQGGNAGGGSGSGVFVRQKLYIKMVLER